MTVLVANDVPPAIRGLLKRWFIEPRANVFVGTVNRRTREKTLEFIRRNAPDMGLLMIASAPRTSQGFEIHTWGPTNRTMINLCGLQLIAEAWNPDSDKLEDQPDGDAQPDDLSNVLAEAAIGGSLTKK